MTDIQIFKETQDFINSLPQNRPIQDLGYEGARAFLSKIQAQQRFEEDITRNDYEVLMPDNNKVHLRIVKPIDAQGALPVVFYVHGGGWVMGDAMSYDHVLRKIARHTKCAVAFAEYSLAPHARFPRPLKELWVVLEHLLDNPKAYHINPYHIILMGDSVGGNMATVLASYAAQRGIHIDFQILLYPVMSARMNTASYETFSQGPWLTKEAMKWFFDAYMPDIVLRKQEQISPLFLAPDKMAKLPPALIVTAQNDVLRDEGEAYALRLAEQGVDATCVRISGAIHDFMMLAPLRHTLPTKVGYALVIGMIRKIFKHAFEIK